MPFSTSLFSVLFSAGVFLLTSLPVATAAPNQPTPSGWQQLKDLFGPRRRRGGTRGGFCLITPGYRGEPVWSDRPLLVWQKTNQSLKRIEIRTHDQTVVWSQNLPSAAQTIAYQGTALQPHQPYQVILYNTQDQPLIKVDYLLPQFTLMSAAERQRVQQELLQIEHQLKAQAATGEAIALNRATYFVQNQYWSDALQILYSVPHPSPELMQLLAAIEAEACGSS